MKKLPLLPVNENKLPEVGDKIKIKYGNKIIELPIRRLKRDEHTWQGKTEDRSIYYVLPPDREDKPGAEIAISASELL